ncbi:MAG: helix-turn-helix transcriptional regulator [Chthoniobacterales bacterium]|nr:helix-turn-helix transcriptional regulator [Chthoniobacterales bacterium]
MVKRTSHRRAKCPVARPLDTIGDQWSMLVIRDAFEELRHLASSKRTWAWPEIFCLRLRNLVEHGILDTAPATDGSAYQEYVLTEKGRGLFPVLVARRAAAMGRGFFLLLRQTHVLLVDRKFGLPVRKLELRSQDRRLIGATDTAIKAF